MTVVRVEQQPDLTYRVHLPFRVATAVDEAHARRLVYGEAPGSAIRWVPMSEPSPISESEMRALFGDR